MNPRERNLLICYVSIISGIAVAIFGYYLVPGMSRVYPGSPLYFVLPLIIIYILSFVSTYYWKLVQREWFEYKQKPVKFWIFYTGGIVVGILGFLYLTFFEKERNEFEFAWVFLLLILIGTIFHSIYWMLIWYDKL